jgi:hypothetical protein
MRKRGSKFEYESLRNHELRKAYKRAMVTSASIRSTECLKIAVNSPCSRFWVSEERAAVVIAAMMRGENPLQSMGPNKREMYEEIYSRFMDVFNDNPETPIRDLVHEVVMQPAPKFYLTPSSAGVILSKMKEKKLWTKRKR